MATVLAVGAALLFMFALLVLGMWYFVDNVPKSYRSAQLKFGLHMVDVCLLLIVGAELID